MVRLIFLFSFISMASSATAEIISAGDNGFGIRHTIVFDHPAKQVYQAVTGKVDQWWLADHSWSGEANNLYMEPKAGGCFCERLHEGGSAVHMLITYLQPGKEIRMTGGLGPLQMMGLHGGMRFVFTNTEAGSTLVFTYNVSGHSKDGLTGLAPIVDQVWQDQLASLSAFMAPED